MRLRARAGGEVIFTTVNRFCPARRQTVKTVNNQPTRSVGSTTSQHTDTRTAHCGADGEVRPSLDCANLAIAKQPLQHLQRRDLNRVTQTGMTSRRLASGNHGSMVTRDLRTHIHRLEEHKLYTAAGTRMCALLGFRNDNTHTTR